MINYKKIQKFLIIAIVGIHVNNFGMFFRKKSEVSSNTQGVVRSGVKAGVRNFVAKKVEATLEKRFSSETKVENNQTAEKNEQQNSNRMVTIQEKNSNRPLQTTLEQDVPSFIYALQNLQHKDNIENNFKALISTNHLLQKIHKKQEKEVTCCDDLVMKCLDMLPESYAQDIKRRAVQKKIEQMIKDLQSEFHNTTHRVMQR